MKMSSLKLVRNLFLGVLAVGAFHQSDAALLTYWNFNNTSPGWNSGASQLGSFSTTGASYGEAYTQVNSSTPGTLASNTSNGTIFNGSAIKIDFSNINSVNITNPTINGKKWSDHSSQAPTSDPAGFGAFVGYSLNAVSGDADGNSLLLLNTGGNMRDRYITLSLSSAGYESLSLSYATRLTNSVTSSQVWTYSTDGINFSSLSTVSPTANGNAQLVNLDLSTLSGSALNNQSAFYLRLTYTSSNAQGSQAIDNIQLNGVAIPEPSALAFAVAGLGIVLVRTRARARSC